MDFEKLATVIDSLANYMDALEQEKTASTRAARESVLSSISEKYAEATGEEFPENLLPKLAESDEMLLEVLEKLSDIKKEAVDDMGSPSGRRDFSVEPQNKKEAAALADERFLAFLTE
jgi:hypothetical protein